jgi:purine operon repressor
LLNVDASRAEIQIQPGNYLAKVFD